MKWTRHRAAVGDPVLGYLSGPYRIARASSAQTAPWHLTGPGAVTTDYDRLADAKAAAERVARSRVADQKCQPMVGDHVEVTLVAHKGRRGQITAIIRGAAPERRADIHVIKFARGRKLCLRRDEFEVVLP